MILTILLISMLSSNSVSDLSAISSQQVATVFSDPRLYPSASEWMAIHYVTCHYTVDHRLSWCQVNDDTRLYDTREETVERMLELHSTDYSEFFKPHYHCAIAHHGQECA